MILGTYEVRNQHGALLGSFTYTDIPGSQSMANNASLERLANLKVHGPKGEKLTRIDVKVAPRA